VNEERSLSRSPRMVDGAIGRLGGGVEPARHPLDLGAPAPDGREAGLVARLLQRRGRRSQLVADLPGRLRVGIQQLMGEAPFEPREPRDRDLSRRGGRFHGLVGRGEGEARIERVFHRLARLRTACVAGRDVPPGADRPRVGTTWPRADSSPRSEARRAQAVYRAAPSSAADGRGHRADQAPPRAGTRGPGGRRRSPPALRPDRRRRRRARRRSARGGRRGELWGAPRTRRRGSAGAGTGRRRGRQRGAVGPDQIAPDQTISVPRTSSCDRRRPAPSARRGGIASLRRPLAG
jgi:hypothetical protein